MGRNLVGSCGFSGSRSASPANQCARAIGNPWDGTAKKLRIAGWKVVRIWECQLSTKKQARVVARIRKALGKESRKERLKGVGGRPRLLRAEAAGYAFLVQEGASHAVETMTLAR